MPRADRLAYFGLALAAVACAALLPWTTHADGGRGLVTLGD